MRPLLSPVCPRCNMPPWAVMSPKQAFCGNGDCGSFSWDMTKTPEENEAGVSYHCLDCGKALPAAATTCDCLP